MSQKPRVIFLHVPKTAGQSVHEMLRRLFEPEAICPARENFQLLPITIAQLRRYHLFSGHLDWCLLDTVPAPRFVFTVMRRPIERILSFYFFLRSRASKVSDEVLQAPEYQGLNAALNLSPDEYFSGGPAHLRQFIDDHYDNFYAYYFCGRSFDARRKLRGVMLRQSSDITEPQILENALANIRELDRVYTTSNLDLLEADIRTVLGLPASAASASHLHVNRGDGDFASRLERLRELGATDRTFDRLQEMTKLDDKIWEAITGN